MNCELRENDFKANWQEDENPMGFRRQFLGKPAFTFNPCDFGDAYTKKTDLWGYVKNNLFEPKSLLERHEKLVGEMIKREYKHRTPIFSGELEGLIQVLPVSVQNAKINKRKSLEDLVERCPKCKFKYLETILIIGDKK